jgi:hypothetical protein
LQGKSLGVKHVEHRLKRQAAIVHRPSPISVLHLI